MILGWCVFGLAMVLLGFGLGLFGLCICCVWVGWLFDCLGWVLVVVGG